MSYETIIIRTLLAVLLSSIIGFERERKHRPAGLRTHILVCLGAMSIMLLSEYLFVHYADTYGVTSDPARLSAQVISGIGFLGAGAIIRSGQSIKGLTTAASLWVVAALGLIVGAGFYALAVTVTVILFTILFIFDKLSKKVFHSKSKNTTELHIELINKPKNLGLVSMFFANKQINIRHMEFLGGSDEQRISDIVNVRVIIESENASYEDISGGLLAIGGVVRVEKI